MHELSQAAALSVTRHDARKTRLRHTLCPWLRAQLMTMTMMMMTMMMMTMMMMTMMMMTMMMMTMMASTGGEWMALMGWHHQHHYLTNIYIYLIINM